MSADTRTWGMEQEKDSERISYLRVYNRCSFCTGQREVTPTAQFDAMGRPKVEMLKLMRLCEDCRLLRKEKIEGAEQ